MVMVMAMSKVFVVEPFGQIDISNDDYWEAAVSYRGQDLSLDLNTDQRKVADAGVTQANLLLSNIQELDAKAREAISEEHLDTEGDARLFHTHHHDCVDSEAWHREIGESKPPEDDWDGFLNQCRLKRIGIYIEDKDQFAILDYTLGEQLTDYTLSVVFDATGQARSVMMES